LLTLADVILHPSKKVNDNPDRSNRLFHLKADHFFSRLHRIVPEAKLTYTRQKWMMMNIKHPSINQK